MFELKHRGQIYCHGTRSRIPLVPSDLINVIDITCLKDDFMNYYNAMKKCGDSFVPDVMC